MDTPVSKSGQQHVFVPVNFYLRALDYPVYPEATTSPTPNLSLTRATVGRLRSERLAEIDNIVARARRQPQAVRDADRNGAAEYPADLLVSIASDLGAAAQRLYRDIQEAKARYVALMSADVKVDDAADQGGITPPPAAGGITVQFAKPADIHHPVTMEQALAIRAVKLGNGGRPAGRGGW